MSALDYLAFAYLGVFVFCGLKCKKGHLSVIECSTIISLIPVIPLLFICTDLSLCAIRCIVLTLPIKFYLLDGIDNNSKSLKKSFWSVVFLWTGLAVLEFSLYFLSAGRVCHLFSLLAYYVLAGVFYVIFQIISVKHICIIEDIYNPAYIYETLLVKISLNIYLLCAVYSFFELPFYSFLRFLVYIFLFLFHLGFVFYSFYPDKRKIGKKPGVKKYYHVNEDGVMNLLKDGGWSEVDETAKDDMKIIYALLKLFDTQKPYRRYDIKVQDVASLIGTNKTYLSRALNKRLSKNFSQFVNAYRIKDVCEAFIKDSSQDLRDIADNYGFNSQSNFSIVFKCHVGHTPSDWCKEVRRRIANNEVVKLEDYDL